MGQRHVLALSEEEAMSLISWRYLFRRPGPGCRWVDQHEIFDWPIISWHRLKWRIRGVGLGEDYRTLCRRCGRTGQVHFEWKGCWRFKR